jgi:hypothetical protein
MLNKLTIITIVAALALASAPALAFDIPDYGSKNFSPGSDTPSYFTNESVPVAARTADTTERDWSAVEAVAPERSEVAAAPRSNTERHGRHLSAQRSWKHTVGKSKAKGHSTRLAKASTGKAAKTASLHGPAKQARVITKASPARMANAKSTASSATAQSDKATAAKTRTAKHGKAGARHARAAITEPAAIAGTNLPKEA